MLLVDVAIRSTLILFAAWLATRALRPAAASTRHLVWTLAMIAVLVLPALMVALPELPLEQAFIPRPARTALSVLAQSSPDFTREEGLRTGSAEALSERTGSAHAVSAGTGWAEAMPYVLWALVTLALLARIAAGIASVGRLASRARPADARWRAMFDEALAGDPGKRPVRLLVSREVAMPMTWGGTRPVLLLPEDSRDWSDDRCRVVLLHELAHILRGDWLSHTLGRLVLAAHWFNPLAWIAMRAMTRERERACDDYVLTRGARATDYAQHLLDIARADGRDPAWGIAPAMARRTELEGRLLSILTPHPRDGNVFARRVTVLGAAVVAAAVAAAAPAASQMVQPAPLTTTRPLPATTASPAMASTEEAQAERDAGQRERKARNTVLGGLDNPSDDVREKSVIALAIRSEPNVIDPLLRALRDPSSQVREKAAIGLAFRRRPDVVDALLAAAHDPDSQVREKVIFALSLSGDERAIAALTAALDDPDAQVREKATQGLALSSLFQR